MCVEITFEQEDSSSGLGRERADGGVGCPFDGLYAPLETSTGRVGSFFRWKPRIYVSKRCYNRKYGSYPWLASSNLWPP